MKLPRLFSTCLTLLTLLATNLRWRWQEPTDEWMGEVSEEWLKAVWEDDSTSM